MVGIPETFTKLSPVLANYDFTDVISGTGYINFYAGKTIDKYLLSNFTYYSSSLKQTANTATSSAVYTSIIDVDFDTVLNRPLDVKGLGIVNIPLSLIYVVVANPAGTAYAYAKVTLRKWDGVTETDIVTNDGTEFTSSTTQTYNTDAVDLTIPLTHFKIGETLRLTIQIYAKTSGANGYTTAGFAYDPMNRTTGWDTSGAVPSQLKFLCPVRLNI